MPDMLVIGALALVLSIVVAIFVAEVTSAVLPALILFYLVPTEERAELAALIEATRARRRTGSMISALCQGLVVRFRSR